MVIFHSYVSLPEGIGDFPLPCLIADRVTQIYFLLSALQPHLLLTLDCTNPQLLLCITIWLKINNLWNHQPGFDAFLLKMASNICTYSPQKASSVSMNRWEAQRSSTQMLSVVNPLYFSSVPMKQCLPINVYTVIVASIPQSGPIMSHYINPIVP